MGYLTPRTSTNTAKNAELIQVTVSSAPSVNSYFVLSIANSTYSSSASITGTNTLVLPTGHYKAACFFAVDKTNNGRNNYQYQLELDSILIGFAGQTKSYNNFNVDSSDAVFSVTSGTSNLKLKLLAIENAAPSHYLNESILWIWRTAL